MNRILNLAACTAFVAVASANALADGIVNGTFEQVSTCPWVAFKTPFMDPPFPVVRAPSGNPCSFLKIETGHNEDSAAVRQEGFPVQAENDDWVILEFDARVSGTNPSAAASVKFEVTWAETIFREIPDSPVDADGNPIWVHYKLAT
ncbi:MAG: hypothetical protein IH830_04115 [Planctomycetes bacterium]|nr:hypothetical protein [Planctomycetota bacterium]